MYPNNNQYMYSFTEAFKQPFNPYQQSPPQFLNEMKTSSQLQTDKTDYYQHIEKPPARNITHGSITLPFVIDSRDRDLLKYPNSNKFRVNVPNEWRDITSAELVSATIPNVYENITKTNNIFYIAENTNELFNIEIPNGCYTNQKLLDTLNGNYGELFSGLTNKYHFSQDPISLLMRISSNRANDIDFIYNFDYTTNDTCMSCNVSSIDTMIGFINNQYQSFMIDLTSINVLLITDLSLTSDNDYPIYKLKSEFADFASLFCIGDYFLLNDGTNTYSNRIYSILNANVIEFENIDSTASATLTALTGNIFKSISVLYSPHIYNIDCLPYIILNVGGFHRLNSNSFSDDAFAIIPLQTGCNTILNNTSVSVGGITKFFNPPHARLPFIDVSFHNYDGSLFDFKGQNVMIVMKFTALNQPGKYNNYNQPTEMTG